MRLLIFGLGYTARAVADRLTPHGWRVVGTTRDGRDGSIAFADADRVRFEARAATAILSSVPPDAAGDPVLAAYGDALDGATLAYLSSTGVYGDADGGWVDEATPLTGRRARRNAADLAWLARGRARIPPARHLRSRPFRARPGRGGGGAPRRIARTGVQPRACRRYRRRGRTRPDRAAGCL